MALVGPRWLKSPRIIPPIQGPAATSDVLWESEPAAESGYDTERQAPFDRAINVFGRGVPS